MSDDDSHAPPVRQGGALGEEQLPARKRGRGSRPSSVESNAESSEQEGPRTEGGEAVSGAKAASGRQAQVYTAPRRWVAFRLRLLLDPPHPHTFALIPIPVPSYRVLHCLSRATHENSA